ncbi:alpha/beta hydrolase [Corynebacterium sp.]|uniref:alpha/beta hydrolase n=1 Tax=Corynebacterium sp. TaxID=1720 RepID=UPI0026DCBBEA|nr:alpha/beta hydrolase [Corynebacterium sp.]MDO4914838.1 alpha/beta hydrolase [Corynebacterium sp.]
MALNATSTVNKTLAAQASVMRGPLTHGLPGGGPLTHVPQWSPDELNAVATSMAGLIGPLTTRIADSPIPATIIGGINGDAANASLKSINADTRAVIDHITQSVGLLRAHSSALRGPLCHAQSLEHTIKELQAQRDATADPFISTGLYIIETACKADLALLLKFLDTIDGVLAHLLVDVWNSPNFKPLAYVLADAGITDAFLPTTVPAPDPQRDNSQPWLDGHTVEDTDRILRERLDTWLSTAHDDKEKQYLEGILKTLADNDDAYLVHIDHDGVAIALGDPTTSPAVATLVGGVGSSEPGRIHGHTDWAREIRQASGNKASVIAWSAYPAPRSLPAAASTDNATRGAQNLRSFQQSLRTRNPSAQLTVTGHSYGSVVVGHAARSSDATSSDATQSDTTPPLEADTVVIVGSPGTGANHAHELAPHALDGHAEIVVGRNDADPIMITTGPEDGAHGPDPSYAHWGADAWLTPNGLAATPPSDQKIRDLGGVYISKGNFSELMKNHRYRDYSAALAQVITDGVPADAHTSQG